MVFLVAILSLMGLRYKTKTKMEEIKRLTAELLSHVSRESRKFMERGVKNREMRESSVMRIYVFLNQASSATLSLALLDLGFSSISFCEG